MVEPCQYKVIQELTDLSKEADHIIEEYVEGVAVESWLQLVKNAVFKINSSSTIQDVEKAADEVPELINFVDGELKKCESKLQDEFSVSQKEHLHVSENISKSYLTTDSVKIKTEKHNENINKKASLSPVVVLQNMMPAMQHMKTKKIICDTNKCSNFQACKTSVKENTDKTFSTPLNSSNIYKSSIITPDSNMKLNNSLPVLRIKKIQSFSTEEKASEVNNKNNVQKHPSSSDVSETPTMKKIDKNINSPADYDLKCKDSSQNSNKKPLVLLDKIAQFEVKSPLKTTVSENIEIPTAKRYNNSPFRKIYPDREIYPDKNKLNKISIDSENENPVMPTAKRYNNSPSRKIYPNKNKLNKISIDSENENPVMPTASIDSENKNPVVLLNKTSVYSSEMKTPARFNGDIDSGNKSPVVLLNKMSVYSSEIRTPVRSSGNFNEKQNMGVFKTPVTKSYSIKNSTFTFSSENSSKISPDPKSNSNKRKSSTKKLPKKLKTEVSFAESTTATATSKNVKRQPLSVRNECPKSSAVILNNSVKALDISALKNKQILEEIKKKEAKADQNLKKVLAERNMKAEESKRKREQKIEKTALKRQKLEKEKEQRLGKSEIFSKKTSQSKRDSAKKPEIKLKSKEIDQNDSKRKVKQQVTNTPLQNKTPVRRTQDSVKDDIEEENYDITPFRPSSANDADDENEPSLNHKKIPHWAKGVHLQQAIVQQHYNPPDITAIFGSVFDPPELSKILGVTKPTYKKRTSSAFWAKTPNHSLLI